MGSNLSSIECCIDREHEEDGVVPLNSYRAQYEENQIQGKQSTAANSSEEALQVQLDAIRNAKQQAASADSDLSEKINAVVKSRDGKVLDSLDIALQHRLNAIKTAKAKKLAQPPASQSNDLQDQINAIVGSHAKSIKHQRVLLTDPTAMASPSPAKSFSDMDIASYANLALSSAKERATPGMSPSALPVHWEGCDNQVSWPMYECDFSPCELSFVDGVNTFEPVNEAVDMFEPNFTTYDEDLAPCQLSFEEPQKVSAEPETCAVQPKEKCIVAPKVEPRPFDINEIPSPTRNRAKREQWALAQEEAGKDGGDAPRAQSKEECEQEAAAVKEAKLLEEKKAQRAAEEMEDRLQMDKVCVDTFLESVNACAWRERVRTPIKGSNLYVKHIRPCRAMGTSVDVKDSSFMNLGNFLRFLEGEGLLRLKPGASDPVVMEIRYNNCSNYQYVAQGSTMQVAPHETGCSCRKCTPVIASWQ